MPTHRPSTNRDRVQRTALPHCANLDCAAAARPRTAGEGGLVAVGVALAVRTERRWQRGGGGWGGGGGGGSAPPPPPPRPAAHPFFFPRPAGDAGRQARGAAG